VKLAFVCSQQALHWPHRDSYGSQPDLGYWQPDANHTQPKSNDVQLDLGYQHPKSNYS
jgi:hypothetical protein